MKVVTKYQDQSAGVSAALYFQIPLDTQCMQVDQLVTSCVTGDCEDNTPLTLTCLYG